MRDAAKGVERPPEAAGGLRHIGKGTPRVDAEEIVSGAAAFISDLKLPGMLYGKVLRSPHPHANILDIDTEGAERLPGVRAVVTYKNAPDWKAGNPRYVPVLEQRLRFVGDAVALVAADTEEIAEEALRLIKVKYEVLPAVFDVEEAMKQDAPQLYPQFAGNVAPRGFIAFGPNTLQEVVRGDVDAGFDEADFVAEGTYGYEGIPNPLPAEPPGAIAMWEGPDKLTVWSATQSPFLVRNVISAAMGAVDIRSIASQCGGSFGSKNCAVKPIFYAAALAQGGREGDAGKGGLYEGRALLDLFGAIRFAHPRQGGHQEGRQSHGVRGRLAHQHGKLRHLYPRTGGRRSRRGSDHAPLRQLEPPALRGLYEPDRLRRGEGLRRPGAEVCVSPHPDARPGEGGPRPRRFLQEQFRQGR